MTTVLAVDTATNACSVALWQADDCVASRYDDTPRAQALHVLPMVDAVLAQAQCALSKVEVLAFGQGPGSFTGVRIATALVQGLGFGQNIPCLGISNLAALAQGALRQHPSIIDGDMVAAAFDARQQQVYAGCYRVDEGICVSVQDEVVADPDQVNWPEIDRLWAVGEGWQAYPDLMAGSQPKASILSQPVSTDAVDIARLAARAMASGVEGVKAALVQPVYLRHQVVG